MAVLTDVTNATKKATTKGAALHPSYRKVKAGVDILYYGGMVLLDGGYGIMASGVAQGHLRVVGRAVGSPPGTGQASPETSVDNSGGAVGDKQVLVEAGIFSLANDAGVGALVDADFGEICYLADDQTVSRHSNKGNYPVAGYFLGLDPETSRPWVAIGLGAEDRPRFLTLLAGADLSAAANKFKAVKQDGAGAVVLSAAAADRHRGILVNTPANGAAARVCVWGPCPMKSSTGAGFAVGVDLTAEADAELVAAASTNRTVGYSLEAAAAGETKMGFVQPGYQP